MNILFYLFCSMNATAYPNVGDKVDFDVQWGTRTGTLEQSLTDYNASTKKFLEVTTATFAGEAPSTNTAWKGQSDLQSPQKIQMVLSTCTVLGGTLESIATPAGTFKTCALNENSGSLQARYWFGDVPWGVVRFEVTDSGGFRTGLLRSVTSP